MRVVSCPVCQWGGERFLPCGDPPRLNARCPECASKERHRLLHLYLATVLPEQKDLRVLHVAPEEPLRRLFLSYLQADYLSIDIDPDRLQAMRREDLTALTLESDRYDIICCCHVLEHVQDDRKAMQELYRVLASGGFAVIQVPLFDRDKTLEDRICEPKDRLRFFGQANHHRAYGRDFGNRLASAGLQGSRTSPHSLTSTSASPMQRVW